MIILYNIKSTSIGGDCHILSNKQYLSTTILYPLCLIESSRCQGRIHLISKFDSILNIKYKY
jgi:hypothetical protein